MADTARRIIDSVDARCPNQIELSDKCRRLEEMEKFFFDSIFSRFCGCGEIQLYTHEAGEDLAKDEMAIPEPYSKVYEYGLEMLIHQTNGDIDHYNNAQILYRDQLNDFEKYWTRTHMPKRAPRFRL